MKGNTVRQGANVWVPYDETPVFTTTGQLTSSWGEGEDVDRIGMAKKCVFRYKWVHKLHCYLNEVSNELRLC